LSRCSCAMDVVANRRDDERAAQPFQHGADNGGGDCLLRTWPHIRGWVSGDDVASATLVGRRKKKRNPREPAGMMQFRTDLFQSYKLFPFGWVSCGKNIQK
jgi:hypothetical protein